MPGERKDLNALMKESWGFFRERWVPFFKITIFIWFPVTFIVGLFWVFLLGTYNTLKHNKELLFSPKVIASAGIIVIFLSCILAIAMAIQQIIKTKLINTLLTKKGEPYYLNFSIVVKEALPDFWPVLSTGSLVFINVLLGLFLLVFPGVLFAIWFAFVPFEVILKKKKGWDALISSRNIIRYNLGKFLGNTLAIFILLIFINISVSGLSQLIIMPFKSEATAGLANLISTIVSNIFGVWGFVFNFMLYRELDKRYQARNNQIITNEQIPMSN